MNFKQVNVVSNRKLFLAYEIVKYKKKHAQKNVLLDFFLGGGGGYYLRKWLNAGAGMVF